MLSFFRKGHAGIFTDKKFGSTLSHLIDTVSGNELVLIQRQNLIFIVGDIKVRRPFKIFRLDISSRYRQFKSSVSQTSDIKLFSTTLFG